MCVYNNVVSVIVLWIVRLGKVVFFSFYFVKDFVKLCLMLFCGFMVFWWFFFDVNDLYGLVDF